MINFSFSGIKNTLASFNVFSFSFKINFGKKESPDKVEQIADKAEDEVKQPIDFKTTYGSETDVIELLQGDLIVYLFIDKHKYQDSGAWNSVLPVVIETPTGRVSQFGLGYFALEGTGGGLSNTDSIFYYLKKHIQKGFKVTIIPKIVENDMLRRFEHVDSGIELKDLIDNSIDLYNYRKNEFERIYKKYKSIGEKYQIETV